MRRISCPDWCSKNATLCGALAVPAFVFVISFASGVATSHAGAYTIAACAFFVGMALVAVEILGLKVGGRHLRLEQQIGTVQAENKRLKEAVEALLKSQFVLADAVRYPMYGGPSVPHMRMLRKYLGPVEQYLDDGIISATFEELEHIAVSRDAREDEGTMTLAQRWQRSFDDKS